MIDPTPVQREGWLRRMIRYGAALEMSVMIVIVAAWLIGRVVSDHWVWSQWLLWIPTLVALAACVLGLLMGAIAFRGTKIRRRWVSLWVIAVVLIGGWFSLIEHHLLRRPSNNSSGLNVVQWNMAEYKHDREDQFVDALAPLEADLMVITGMEEIAGRRSLMDWLEPRARVSFSFPFMIITKLPIREHRPLMRSDEIAVDLLVLSAADALDGEIRIHLVDLPSKPGASRAAVAERFVRMMTELGEPQPDLAIGDFNITRDSRSLSRMYPGMRHAFHEAGAGYAATFPRRWPLFHIDHLLLGPAVKAHRYEIIDPGLGRHRGQRAWIGRQAEAP